jgi:hypothetical protein
MVGTAWAVRGWCSGTAFLVDGNLIFVASLVQDSVKLKRFSNDRNMSTMRVCMGLSDWRQTIFVVKIVASFT